MGLLAWEYNDLHMKTRKVSKARELSTQLLKEPFNLIDR